MLIKSHTAESGRFLAVLTFIIAFVALLLAVSVYFKMKENKTEGYGPGFNPIQRARNVVSENKEAPLDKQKEQELELKIHLLQSKAEVAAARVELATQKGKVKTRQTLQKAIDELNAATKQAEEKAKPELEKLKKQLEGINQDVEKGAANASKKLEEWTKSLESMMQGKKETDPKK
jgi:hypothetical protein